MKSISRAVILMLALFTLSSAQNGSGFSVFLSSGFVLPSSPMTFAQYWKVRYGGSVGAGYALSSSVTLLGSFEYHRFTLDLDRLHGGFDTQYMRDIWAFTDVSMDPSASSSSVMTISAGLRVAPSGTNRFVAPYGIVGVGIMRFSLAEIAIPTTSRMSVGGTDLAMTAERMMIGGNETAFVGQAGIGVDVALSTWFTPYLEARYVLGFTDGVNTSYVPLTAGLRIGF